MVATSSAIGAHRGFLGQEKGLYYLAFTEAWERFSYYGMTGLLVLYLVDQLLLPGHAEHVAGLAGLRSKLEWIAGPLSPQGFASQIFGFYSGLVYFTPLLGGMIADRWIGQRNAVVIGALSMAAGHIAMTLDATFLLALLLLTIGSGFLKGNIATQVGALYRPDDEARRAHGYVIFSTGINVGAILGPLSCGLLAQLYGWHYGFGIAAIFMLLGLATYLYGYRYLPARVQRTRHDTTTLTWSDWRLIGALVATMAITVFPLIAFMQIYNVMPLWIQEHVAESIGGLRIPVPWYLSINSLFSVLSVPLLFWIWRCQASRRGEPDYLAKIGVGAWLTALCYLVLATASLGRDANRVGPIWPFLHSACIGISFMYYWPTLLALTSQAAPPVVNATLMGTAYLSLFVSSILVGWIGGLYERMHPAGFWALHAAIAAADGLIVLMCGNRLRRALRLRSLSQRNRPSGSH